MKRFALLVSLALAGCDCGGGSGGAKHPGDELMGTFAMDAKGIFSACTLLAPANEYSFTATISRFRDGGAVFFVTTNSKGQSLTYDAGFDGQYVAFESTVTDDIGLLDGGSCKPCEMRTTEVAKVALLSQSQNDAVADACPASALDGGVPEPDDAGTITRPRSLEDGGFDAVRACGEIVATVIGEGIGCDPACYSCKLHYRWGGALKK